MMLGLGWSGDVHNRPVEYHLATESAKHLGHQRDVENVWAVGDGAGALGQQSRSHQLENAVLRAAHRHFADEPVATGYQKAFTHSSTA